MILGYMFGRLTYMVIVLYVEFLTSGDEVYFKIKQNKYSPLKRTCSSPQQHMFETTVVACSILNNYRYYQSLFYFQQQIHNIFA